MVFDQSPLRFSLHFVTPRQAALAGMSQGSKLSLVSRRTLLNLANGQMTFAMVQTTKAYHCEGLLKSTIRKTSQVIYHHNIPAIPLFMGSTENMCLIFGGMPVFNCLNIFA